MYSMVHLHSPRIISDLSDLGKAEYFIYRQPLKGPYIFGTFLIKQMNNLI